MRDAGSLVAGSLAPVTGETGIVNLGWPVGDIRRYGAPMNGVLDDAPAIASALTNVLALRASTLILPLGTIRPLSNVVASVLGGTPKGLKIKGYGRNTILRPGPAVTTALTLAGEANSDGLANPVSLEGLTIDMVDTTSAVGLLVGDNAGHLSAYHELNDIQVWRATGAGGVGMQVKDVVGLTCRGLVLGRSAINMLIQPSDLTMPTALRFVDNCQFRAATNQNIKMVNVWQALFVGAVIELAANEGVYIVPPNVAPPPGPYNNVMISFVTTWFEGNNSAGNYQLVVDGSTLGAGTCMVSVQDDSYFAGVAKSISFKNVNNLAIRRTLFPNAAATILIDNCSGEFSEWPENNGAFKTLVSIINSGDRVLTPIQYRNKFDQQVVAAGHFVVNVQDGDYHELDVTTAAAFTVDNPTGDDQATKEQLIGVKNLFGGALGAATWSANYQLSEAWVNPTAGNTRMIRFRRNPNTAKFQQVVPSTLVAN